MLRWILPGGPTEAVGIEKKGQGAVTPGMAFGHRRGLGADVNIPCLSAALRGAYPRAPRSENADVN